MVRKRVCGLVGHLGLVFVLSAIAEPRSGGAALSSDVEFGRHLFAKAWKVSEGLGPFVNAQSCAACHSTPTLGGSGTTRESFVPIAVNIQGVLSGQIFQRFQVTPSGLIRPRTLPSLFVIRKAPPLYGLGLLEAVSDEFILQYADPDDSDRDGISGWLPRREGRSLRFGWKSKAATINEIVRLALRHELGLTAPLDPNSPADTLPAEPRPEVTGQELDSLSRFVRFLQPVPRQYRVRPKTVDVRAVGGQTTADA
jgi:hypothetical protein